jgi:hypothetical protein
MDASTAAHTHLLGTYKVAGLPSLDECRSIAEDYIALGTELGVPPMPEAWW